MGDERLERRVLSVRRAGDLPPLKALAFDVYRRPRRIGPLRMLGLLFRSGETRRALALIRLLQHCHAARRPRLARWADRRLRRDYGCFIQAGAVIGPGLQLPHPTGIVIGSGVRIGSDCIIYQQVTLGGARRGDWRANHYPDVGDRVTLFAGAKLLGAISVGHDVVVGANAVVTADVPAAHCARGIPARSFPARTVDRAEPEVTVTPS